MSANEPHEELLAIADRLEGLSERAAQSEIMQPLDRLEEAATRIGKTWSGSCLGYHSRIYYKDLKPPPPGAHFSPEWGLKDAWPIRATTGEWEEFDPVKVEETIRKIAGSPDLEPARQLSASATRLFESSKADGLSILTTALTGAPDSFIASLKDQAEQLELLSRGPRA